MLLTLFLIIPLTLSLTKLKGNVILLTLVNNRDQLISFFYFISIGWLADPYSYHLSHRKYNFLY